MSLRLISLLLAVCAIAAAPVAASAHDGGRGGGREMRPGAGLDVSKRVITRIRRSERALDRAEERIDDGENARAIAQLTASRRHLASALKTAQKRDDDSLEAVGRAQHNAIVTVAGLFDGVTDGDVVSALDATLDAAVAGRSTADGEDAADEREAIADALADDELTGTAKQSLQDADAAIAATPAATAADDSGAGGPGEGDRPRRRGDCPDREGDDGAGFPSGDQPPARDI